VFSGWLIGLISELATWLGSLAVLGGESKKSVIGNLYLVLARVKYILTADNCLLITCVQRGVRYFARLPSW